MKILYKLTYANKIQRFQGCPVNVQWTLMRVHKTGGAFIIQNASREREMIEIKTGMHIMDHGRDIREILKASTKTLISLDIMCVCLFFLFFLSSQIE